MSNYIGVLRHIALYRRHVVAYAFTRSAPKCACCFHSSVPAHRRQAAELEHDGYQKIFQPGEFVRIAVQPLKQASRSNSQFGPITSGTAGVATCWVPIVGGRVPVPRTLTHVSNAARQLGVQSLCTILFFGIGVKLPARLA